MKVDIYIPDELSDITLEQYQKFERINNEENQDTSFLMHKMVEIFCNIDLKDIAKVRYSDVQKIIAQINKAFDVKHKLIRTFELGGVEFGFIPVLDDMTLGEYVDLDENLSDWDKMHKAMSVLFRPITLKKGERYQIEEYDGMKYQDVMKKMPLDIVMGAMVFFYHLNRELLQTTLNYLQREAEDTLTTQQRETLEQNGVGISQSMELLRVMLPNLDI